MLEASYVRTLDGERLWLAVTGASTDTRLALRPADGSAATEVATEYADGVLTARCPILQSVVVLVDGAPIGWAGGQAAGPTKPPTTRDGRWQLAVESVGGELHILRTPVPARVGVRSITRTNDGVELRFDPPAADAVITLDAATATPGQSQLVTITVDGAEVPVVRRRNDLQRPNFAVVLPAVAPGVRLRWRPDGQLALVAEGSS